MTDSIIVVYMFSFIIGWALNSIYRQYKDDQMFKAIMEKIDEEELAQTEKNIKKAFPLCYIEQDNDTYLLYNKDTNEYMCQGESYNDLAYKVFTDLKIEVCLARADDKAMWFIDGNTKELIEY